MSATVLSVPGKTFLVGEYLAMHGGPSILLNTAPRFILNVVPATGSQREVAFPRESPAGRFLARHAHELSHYKFVFSDPHMGKGGLGASSAQFVLAYAFSASLNPATRQQNLELNRVLTEFRACAWDLDRGDQNQASGADVVSQLTGQVTVFDGVSGRASALSWPFPRLRFTLIRTGQKLATHEHLKTQASQPGEIPLTDLKKAVAMAIRSFSEKDDSLLIQAVKDYASSLSVAHLVAPQTNEILRLMKSGIPGILAAKGCGAMGADVVLILHRKEAADEIAFAVKRQGLEVCGSDQSLSPGLNMRLGDEA